MLITTIKLNTTTEIKIYDNFDGINIANWNALNNIGFSCSALFLETTFNNNNAYKIRLVELYKNDVLVAVCWFQILQFSFKNLSKIIEKQKEKKQFLKDKIIKLLRNKEVNLLHLGNVFFTGDKGYLAVDEIFFIDNLSAIIKSVRTSFDKKIFATLIANIYNNNTPKFISCKRNGFHPFETDPDLFLEIKNNWKNMDDYLNSFSSKYRVRAKKIMATSNNITIKNFDINDIAIHKDKINNLYLNIINNIAMNIANINVDFFIEMKKLYAEKFQFFGYYLEDNLVGFSTIFNVDVESVHIHYIGLNYDVNHSHKLYNRMLYDFVKFGIDNQKNKIHFGRTATEIKTTIGAIPTPMNAFLKIHNKVVNLFLPYILKRIKAENYITRNPFK